MIGRLLRIELRRSGALWFAVGFLLPTVVLLNMTGPWTHGGAVWDEQWTALVLWQRNQLIFTWPVAVGLGTWLGCARRRAGMDEVLTGTPKPVWHRMLVLIAPVAGCLVVAMLVPLVFGAVRVAGYTNWFSTGWAAPLLIGALALVSGAVAGMGLGHALPVPITPAVTTVAAFALTAALQEGPQVFTSDGGLPMAAELLSPALRGPGTVFTTVATEVHIGQMLLFGGLGASGFLLLTLRRARWAAALPVLLGVALALTILPDRASAAYPIDRAAIAPVCAGTTCVTRAHQDLLPVVAAAGQGALDALAVLPNAPGSIREIPGAASTRPGAALDGLGAGLPAEVLPVALGDGQDRFWDGAAPDPDLLRRRMLFGAGTSDCDPEGRDVSETAARLAVVSWLEGDPRQPVATIWRDLRRPAYPQSPESWDPVPSATLARDALFALPRGEQIRRVAALREAGRTCQGDMWSIATRGTSAE